jgi:hypothetical protein
MPTQPTAQPPRTDATGSEAAFIPTSEILRDLFERSPEDVTPSWLIENLRERSFGIVLMLLGLLGIVPGISGVVGILLLYPAWQLMRSRATPSLPRFIANRRLPGEKIMRLAQRIQWPLRKLERIIRPRWPGIFSIARRAVGATIVLLAITLVWPFPFSNIAPAIATMLLALAYLEEDSALLIIAMIAALASFAATGATVWAAIRTTGWLDRLL